MTCPDIETVVDAAALQRRIDHMRRGIELALDSLKTENEENAKIYLKIALGDPS